MSIPQAHEYLSRYIVELDNNTDKSIIVKTNNGRYMLSHDFRSPGRSVYNLYNYDLEQQMGIFPIDGILSRLPNIEKIYLKTREDGQSDTELIWEQEFEVPSTTGEREMAKLDRPKYYPGGVDCSICSNEFDRETPACIITPCNHVFHCHCLHSWINSAQLHNTCPACRAHISSLETVDPDEIDNLGKIPAPKGYVAPPPRVVPGGSGFGKTLNLEIKYLRSL